MLRLPALALCCVLVSSCCGLLWLPFCDCYAARFRGAAAQPHRSTEGCPCVAWAGGRAGEAPPGGRCHSGTACGGRVWLTGMLSPAPVLRCPAQIALQGLLGAQPAATLQEFDLNDCSKEAPCCIHHQNTTKYVGSLMGGEYTTLRQGVCGCAGRRACTRTHARLLRDARLNRSDLLPHRVPRQV